MAENKTIETAASVEEFIASVPDDLKQKDCKEILKIFSDATGFEARMWGPAIIGFGRYHYKYESGREGDAPLAAFSPRKDAVVLYLSSVFDKRDELLQKFGKHKAGKGCIYLKRLSDVNVEVLKEMINASIRHTKSQYA